MWVKESGRASERVNESARAYTHFQLSMKYTTKLPNAKCKIRIMEIEFGVIITIICVLWLGVILIIQSHPFDAVEAYVCHLFGMWNALNVKWNVARVLWVYKIDTRAIGRLKCARRANRHQHCNCIHIRIFAITIWMLWNFNLLKEQQQQQQQQIEIEWKGATEIP